MEHRPVGEYEVRNTRERLQWSVYASLKPNLSCGRVGKAFSWLGNPQVVSPFLNVRAAISSRKGT